MVNNCHCSRFHKTVVDSIKEQRLQMPYKEVSEDKKFEISLHVTDAKKWIFDRVLEEIKNYNADKCSDSDLFKTRFTNSKAVHKVITNREKAEIVFEKCIINKYVEKFYPATEPQEIVIDDLTDPNVTYYKVKYEERLGNSHAIYYATYDYNKITGRNVSPQCSYTYEAFNDARDNYKKAIKNEIQAIMSDLNDDCSII